MLSVNKNTNSETEKKIEKRDYHQLTITVLNNVENYYIYF